MELLTILIPIVIAAATTKLFDLFKQGLTLLDKSPAIVKQVLVAALAFGLTKLSAMLGIQLSTGDIGALTPTDISTILSALIAYLMHNSAQTKKIKSAVGGYISAPLMSVVAGAGLVALWACTALAAPRSLAFTPAAVAADSIHFGAVCQVDEPAVNCQMTFHDSTHARTLGQYVVAGGDTLSLAVACATPLETIVIGGVAKGVNRSGDVSSASIGARAQAVCGDQQPGAPRSFIIFTTSG